MTELFSRLRQAGLKIGPKKFLCARPQVVFLGHVISKHGIQPPPAKIEKIKNMPPPKSLRGLRRVVGMFNWFRKFIKDFSTVAAPLLKLMKKKATFVWTDEQQNAFDKLKHLLETSEVLAFPRYDIPFIVSVDTSSEGTGYMLYQVHPESEFPQGTSAEERRRVVRFGSKALTKYQRSYGPTKLELLGVVNAVVDLAPYLRGSKPFKIQCDHEALRSLMQRKLRGKIYERWIALLSQFNMDIEYKPAAEMAVADTLSRCRPTMDSPASSPDEEDPNFPYTKEIVGNVHLPGGVNIRDLLASSDAEANHIACVHPDALYDAESESDRNMSPMQFSHKRKYRHRREINTRSAMSQTSEDNTSNDTVTHTSAESQCPLDASDSHTQQSQTDQIVDTGTDDHQGVSINATSASSTTDFDVCDTVERQLASVQVFANGDFTQEKMAELQYRDAALKPIIDYMKDNKLPTSLKQVRSLQVQSNDYLLVNNILFHTRIAKSKRTKDMAHYQLVLPQILQNEYIKMYHECPLAGHAGIGDTVDRIKEHFFFDKLAAKVQDYVKSCHDCQSRKVTKAKTKSGIVSYPTPTAKFQVWQVDLLGELPTTQSGHRYVFTAVCMFSKYLVCYPLKNKDTLSMAECIMTLISTYGCPQVIISDQGKETMSKAMKEVCASLNIPQQFTPSFVHHCLGACERTHRTVEERLTPYCKDQTWTTMLAPVVFSINNSVNHTLGYSPHEVVFLERPAFPLSSAYRGPDMDALPVDIHNYIRQHCKKLETVQEEVRKHATAAKLKMVERANETTNPLTLQSGDYVYMIDDTKGKGRKLKPQYTGPYVVTDMVSPHMVSLKNPETNKSLKNAVHLDRLKMAYIREPNPVPYFADKVVTNKFTTQYSNTSTQTYDNAVNNDDDEKSNSDDKQVDEPAHARQSKRVRKQPDRYGMPIEIGHSSVSSGSDGYHKIKRILGTRKKNNRNEFLVQIVGEPAYNAIWVPLTQMDGKGKKKVLEKYPDLL